MLDLRLGQDGYVPAYHWGLEVTAGSTKRMGQIEFKRASSVVGFLFERDGESAAAGCRVELTTRQGADVFTPSARLGAPPTTLAAMTNDRGFFQLVAEVAGEYQLSVATPNRGSLTFPVDLIDRREYRITTALVLQEPATIDLVIQPPVDTRGRPWRIEVVDIGRLPHRELLRQAADRGGHARLSAPATRMVAFVLDSEGQQWASRTIETPPSQQVVELLLPLRWVKGRVTLGGRPITAKLAFSSTDGTRVGLQSDADGEFEGAVPEAERFNVDVAADDPRVRRNLVNVRMPASGDLVLALPDTHLRGRVIDEQGRTQAAAIVSVRCMESGGAEGSVQVRSDDVGVFEVRGLQPGMVAASADSPNGLQSDLYPAQLRDGEAVALELVAREKVTVRGRLVAQSTGLPIAGALVKAVPATALAAHAGIGKTTQSDADGQFELRMVAGTREVDITTMAFGHTLTIQRLSVDLGKRLLIPVPDTGGTLTVEFDPAWDSGDRSAPVVAVVHGGGRESLVYLFRAWAVPNGIPFEAGPLVRMTLPSVAPGDYDFCVTDVASLRQATFRSDDCAHGSVPRGGDAVISLSFPQH